MKNAACLASLMSMLLGTAFPALAAGAREDNSGLVVWIFLGVCALIVVAQLFPALMLLFGMIKGLARGHQSEAHPAARKTE